MVVTFTAILKDQLREKVWGNRTPLQVLQNMDSKKYAEDSDRITNANLKYPIIVTDTNQIIDGYHRLAKAVLTDRKNIQVYVFDKNLLKRFLLDSQGNFVKVHQKLTVSDIVNVWNEKF